MYHAHGRVGMGRRARGVGPGMHRLLTRYPLAVANAGDEEAMPSRLRRQIVKGPAHPLHEDRVAQALQGYRGRPAADLETLRDVVLRASRLAEAVPEIAELDLNPVMAFAPGKGRSIVDARIRVAKPQSHPYGG